MRHLLRRFAGGIVEHAFDSDAIDRPAAIVALITAVGLVLPGQKSVMYGSAASTRVTLTTCAYGLFIGGIGSLWR
jgi:hypothetical protein